MGKEVKISLLAHGMVFYIGESKNSTKRLLELLKEPGKFKMRIQNSRHINQWP